MSSALDQDERELLEEEIREELEREHSQRLEAFESRRADARKRGRERHERKKEAARAELKRQLRVEFFKEKGYLPYIDSRGREIWLPPDEHAWRMKMRRRTRRHTQDSLWDRIRSSRKFGMWALLVVLAVLMGMYLIR